MEVKKRLFLGNLPQGVEEKDVRKKFSQFGQISSVEIKSKEDSTFAFVELSLPSEQQLGACLRATDGSDLHGMRMRVQVAKESFLSRLKAEREGLSAPGKPSQQAPRQAPAGDYNPMQMFKNFHQKPQTTPAPVQAAPEAKKKASFTPQQAASPPTSPKFGLKKFGGTKSVVKEENGREEEEEGNLMTKLEKFSGTWNDLDEAPVEIDTQRKSKEPPIPPAPVPEPPEDPEEIKRKQLDNQKRVQSLEQRNQAIKAQHNLIKSALSFNNNNQANKKIIKFEDDLPDPGQTATNKKPLNGSTSSGKKKKKQLFDEEELMEELEEVKDFKLRPHLDGETGQKLLELQSSYGNDSRFKLDHRFATEKVPEHYDGGGEEELDEEKQRQMSILGSLVPLAPSSGPSNALDSAKNRLGTKAFVRFDPNVKDHVKFEKPAADKDASSGQKSRFGEQHQEPLPEVSSERYYQTTGSLDIGSGSGFSLRTLFQQENPEDVEEAETRKAFHDDGPAEFVKTSFSQSVQQQQQPAGDWMKSTGMWHEPLFLQSGDSRFKEAMDFLLRKPLEEAYTVREKWADHRERLKHFYRNKMRRQSQWLAASTMGGGGKKRSYPMDEAGAAVDDETSYQTHSYGSQNLPAQLKKQRGSFRRR